MKIKLIISGILILFLIFGYFLLSENKKNHSEITNIQKIEREKYMELYGRFQNYYSISQNHIDSLEAARQNIKKIYITKYDTIKDTCLRLSYENRYLKNENSLLLSEVNYYLNIVKSCDSQFMLLFVYVGKRDSIKTETINRLISDSVSMQNIILSQQGKIKNKNKKIAYLTGILIAENSIIAVLLSIFK